MARFMVSYDLRQPGRDYAELYEAIKAKGNGWAHPVESVWLLRSDDSAVDIRDALEKHIDSNDGLLVIELGREWAAFGIDQAQSAWMTNSL